MTGMVRSLEEVVGEEVVGVVVVVDVVVGVVVLGKPHDWTRRLHSRSLQEDSYIAKCSEQDDNVYLCGVTPA
jgi:hypothetical protein